MRQFIALFSLCFMVFAIVFAVSNRDAVPLEFWPFPFALQTPLFLIGFACFFMGFVFGWSNYWFYARKRQYAEIKDLRERLRYLKEHSVLHDKTDEEPEEK